MLKLCCTLTPIFSGQLIPETRQALVNIDSKISSGRTKTGGDFFLWIDDGSQVDSANATRGTDLVMSLIT